jgi:hypothetical protein
MAQVCSHTDDLFIATDTLARSSSKESLASAHSFATNARQQTSTKRALPYDEAASKQMKRADMDGPS